MTQFAVETLTVVIFVLVFYQLRGFGDLSSRMVKARDALVAAVAGTVIATLVLFIGASGTTSRLSPYFVDAAPTACAWTKCRQRDSRRFSGIRHTRRNHRSGHRRDRCPGVASHRASTTAMTSLILRTATRFLMPLLLLFALLLLFRGHNEPGGGFVGGLVVAARIRPVCDRFRRRRRTACAAGRTRLRSWGSDFSSRSAAAFLQCIRRPTVLDRHVDDDRREDQRSSMSGLRWSLMWVSFSL